MVFFRRLTRHINRIIKRLDLDNIPPAALLFFGGCFILAVIGYFTWRSDQALLANGREIRAEIIDRRIKETMDCDDSVCTSETYYILNFQYQVDGEMFSKETSVDSSIYDRAESSILVRYLPNRPSVSNVAETVENVLPFPLFSLVTILVGLIGAAVIFFIQS